jgi:hypothetical protein
MAVDARQLLSELREFADPAILGNRGIVHEQQLAPHQPHKLPPGQGAVYIFSISDGWGAQCPAGPGFVLKVGIAGPKSNARFEYQHYNAGSAPSTLAESLLQHPQVWDLLGPSNPNKVSINTWLRARVERDNFYTAGEDEALRRHLDFFLQVQLRPLFEG